jgi:uncharacterized protein with PIN domain
MHDLKLLVTDECGRLARWLRLMGYDTAAASAQPLSALYRKAYSESRIVVTRNRRVKAGCLFRVVYLENHLLAHQLQQLMRELRLAIDTAKTFSRCDRCNVALEPIEKALVTDKVPPYVLQTQETFHVCPSCHRIYWAATHWQRACRFFERLREEASYA